jgi:predicted GIY-YIG superfamily endonuclease
MSDKKYYVYWIVSGRCSYIGATVDPRRRLKQHCGVLKGGARRTRGKLWHFKCVISGFRTWKEALCLEWAAKYYSRRCRSIESRKNAIEETLKRERWTSNSPPSSEVSLTLEYDPVCYGMPPDTFPKAALTASKSYQGEKKLMNKKYKKNLHGVSY